MPVVSKDPELLQLTMNHKIDVAISSSGLCAIVELAATPQTELEIPITVKEHKDGTTY
jgi:hypothetical protein